jgi:hypothetical protein
MNYSNKQPFLWRMIEEIKYQINCTGFKNGFLAGLMVSVFSVVMAAYLVWGLV